MARCVKPEAVYSTPKQPQEHQRRELEPRGALALAIESGSRTASNRSSSTSLTQPSAPRRLRIAVDVDEGELQAAGGVLLTSQPACVGREKGGGAVAHGAVARLASS